MPAGDTDNANPAAGAKRPAHAQSKSEPRKRSKLNDAREWPAAADDAQCFHFIALTQAYLADDMSDDYKKALRRAAKLTPAERAALLTTLVFSAD